MLRRLTRSTRWARSGGGGSSTAVFTPDIAGRRDIRVVDVEQSRGSRRSKRGSGPGSGGCSGHGRPSRELWLQWDWGEGPRIGGRRTSLWSAWGSVRGWLGRVLQAPALGLG
jgi:hypothetical protein